VTVIEHGRQVAAAEDPDVAQAILEDLTNEGIKVLIETGVREVEGVSGENIRIHLERSRGQQAIQGTDLLVATGRTPNTQGIGLETAGIELDAGLCQGKRAARDHRARRLGHGRLRGESTLYARRLRRFPRGPRQPERRQPNNA
jgi:hypothetical protein